MKKQLSGHFLCKFEGCSRSFNWSNNRSRHHKSCKMNPAATAGTVVLAEGQPPVAPPVGPLIVPVPIMSAPVLPAIMDTKLTAAAATNASEMIGPAARAAQVPAATAAAAIQLATTMALPKPKPKEAAVITAAEEEAAPRAPMAPPAAVKEDSAPTTAEAKEETAPTAPIAPAVAVKEDVTPIPASANGKATRQSKRKADM